MRLAPVGGQGTVGRSMLIDWAKFLAALALLLTPIALFHGPRVRYRSVSRDWDRHWPQIFSLGLHTIDLGRAALGTWLLVESLTRAPGAVGAMRQAVLGTHALVLWTAAAVQTFVCKEPDSTHAPFAFVVGVAAAYLAPTVAGFAILFSVIIAAGARMPAGFFAVLGVASVAMGFLFGGRANLINLAIVFVAVVLPALLPIMFKRRMVVSYRARREVRVGTRSPLR
jgi:hypothetical protein